MKKREPTAEERELFERTLGDAKPAKGRGKSQARPVKDHQERSDSPSVSRRAHHAAAPGLDGRTAERLRRGQLDPDARLDLHGLTEHAAHGVLVTFVKGAHARGHRLLLIVTGKGSKEKREDAPFALSFEKSERGVLNEMTPRWLKEPALAGLIADIRHAHRRHGGRGALYVYLRKRAP